jgi:hypothetical protein
MAMDRGRWAEAAEHVELAVATIDEHRMQDYATSVPTFVAAARLAVHRGYLKEANRQPSSAILADITTNGRSATAATYPRAPWPNSNQPAIMRHSPQSQLATRHREFLESPPRHEAQSLGR